VTADTTMKLLIRLSGLFIMLMGIKVLAGSIILSGHLISSLPVILLTISAILTLAYARQYRKFGWLMSLYRFCCKPSSKEVSTGWIEVKAYKSV
jgi:hypothetical protein